MKHIIYTLLVVIAFSSCTTTYFYTTVENFNSEAYKTHNGDIISENDSVSISYSFNGLNAPINITVFNKMNKPLYIDWQRSSIIIDDVATSYFDPNMPFGGSSESFAVTVQEHPHSNISFQSSGGTFRGSMQLPRYVSYIPPQTKIKYNSLSLNATLVGDIKDNFYKNSTIYTRAGFPVNVKEIEFTEQDSPLIFRSYITLYDEANEAFYKDDSFYLSRVIRTSQSPQSLPDRIGKSSDTFYLIKQNNTAGYVVAGAIGVGLLIWSATSVDMDTNVSYP